MSCRYKYGANMDGMKFCLEVNSSGMAEETKSAKENHQSLTIKQTNNLPPSEYSQRMNQTMVGRSPTVVIELMNSIFSCLFYWNGIT